MLFVLSAVCFGIAAAQDSPAAESSCSCDGCQPGRGEQVTLFGLSPPTAAKVKVAWSFRAANTTGNATGSLGCSSNGDVTICAIPGAGVVCLSSKGELIYYLPSLLDMNMRSNRT